MSEEERKELNLKASRLFKSLGFFDIVSERVYHVLRARSEYIGYAHYYLQKNLEESEKVNKADITIYKQLLEIDLKLETTQSEELFECVGLTAGMDLIKV